MFMRSRHHSFHWLGWISALWKLCAIYTVYERDLQFISQQDMIAFFCKQTIWLVSGLCFSTNLVYLSRPLVGVDMDLDPPWWNILLVILRPHLVYNLTIFEDKGLKLKVAASMLVPVMLSRWLNNSIISFVLQLCVSNECDLWEIVLHFGSLCFFSPLI